MVNLLKFTQIVQLINTLKIGVKQSDKLLVSSIDLIVKIIQCNLDLVTSNLVTTCDLVTIFQRPVFAETKSVTKSRLHCMYYSFSDC